MIPIVLGQRDTARQMIREVQLLSRLSHPHVVAYKTAWLEWATPQSLRHLRHLPSFSGDSSSSSTSPSSTSSGAASESASSLRKPAWRHSYKSRSLLSSLCVHLFHTTTLYRFISQVLKASLEKSFVFFLLVDKETRFFV